jgi:hypothetical protein
MEENKNIGKNRNGIIFFLNESFFLIFLTIVKIYIYIYIYNIFF